MSSGFQAGSGRYAASIVIPQSSWSLLLVRSLDDPTATYGALESHARLGLPALDLDEAAPGCADLLLGDQDRRDVGLAGP